MRILVFGDSVTQGFWDPEGGWVQRARRHYDELWLEEGFGPHLVFNLGVSGDSSYELLQRLEHETRMRLDSEGELALVFSVGTNDSRTKGDDNFSTPEKYRENLSELLEISKQFTSKVLFIGLTPCLDERTNPVPWGDTGYQNDRIDQFNGVLRDFCAVNNLSYLEILEPFRKRQNEMELIPDGVHPNSDGHQFIAELVIPEIDKLIK